MNRSSVVMKCDDCVHGEFDGLELDCDLGHRVYFQAPRHRNEEWGWRPLQIACRDHDPGNSSQTEPKSSGRQQPF